MKLLLIITSIAIMGITSDGSENILHLNKPLKKQPEIPVLKLSSNLVAGIKAEAKLKKSPPVVITGDKQLSAWPGITGKGTPSDPYIISNLSFEISDKDAISITKTTSHLILENLLFKGNDNSFPVKNYAIKIGDSKNITVRNCEAKNVTVFISAAVNL